MKSLLLFLLATASLSAQTQLPDTAPIEWPEADLSTRLMDGAHAFVERKIAEAKPKRAALWKPDDTSSAAYERSIAPNRAEFMRMIGVVDPRVAPGMEWHEALISPREDVVIDRISWPVLDGVSGEGLWIVPKESKGFVILVPDADQSPEEAMGGHGDLVPKFSPQVEAYLARNYTILIPTLIERKLYLGPDGNDAKLRQSRQTRREWIYRQAFHMGRHIIGYEVQRVLALADSLQARFPGKPLAITGYGEGGLIAFYAAACDTRFEACQVRGYAGPREAIWSEPIYRNLFGILREFGDREIAMLIGPYRKLEIVNSPPPQGIEEKGKFPKFTDEAVRQELDGVTGGKAEGVTMDLSLPKDFPLSESPGRSGAMGERQERLFRQLENHVQSLIAKSGETRERFFLRPVAPELWDDKWTTDRSYPTHDPVEFIHNARRYREIFDAKAMGRFDEPLLPLHPRSRKIAETEKWTAYDVVLDVYPEMFAWGVLVLPKGIKPEEKRPVVVCQHGRNGLPRDCVDTQSTAYNNFAAKLAERGFITFSPHNLYRGEDRYRYLTRKANSIGCTLFSFITPSHRQILNWLKTQPNVDPARIAFYGLSYGGETAMRVPPILEDYAVVICSGDFNQWTRKVAAVDFPNGFMKSIEWEMPYWNLGQTFDYSDMAALIFPRPFMVERGHHDRVSRDEWVAFEYAKVRWLYAQYGLADRTEIEFFQDGHSINGQGTFQFLHRHLKWPAP